MENDAEPLPIYGEKEDTVSGLILSLLLTLDGMLFRSSIDVVAPSVIADPNGRKL
jgi:hypothetical protein